MEKINKKIGGNEKEHKKIKDKKSNAWKMWTNEGKNQESKE